VSNADVLRVPFTSSATADALLCPGDSVIVIATPPDTLALATVVYIATLSSREPRRSGPMLPTELHTPSVASLTEVTAGGGDPKPCPATSTTRVSPAATSPGSATTSDGVAKHALAPDCTIPGVLAGAAAAATMAVASTPTTTSAPNHGDSFLIITILLAAT
jgi:hypothetical protein